MFMNGKNQPLAGRSTCPEEFPPQLHRGLISNAYPYRGILSPDRNPIWILAKRQSLKN
jgi:hypothetical protein